MDHDHQELPSDPALRVMALESLLVEKGLVDPAALDALIDTYETKVGPRNGARIVARAWLDPAQRNGCSRMPPPRSPNSAASAAREKTCWCSRTRQRCTTWSCARSAPAI